MGGSDSKLGWPVVDMTDTTTIVTGGNTGIGYETAKHIAFLGGRVIIACSSQIQGHATLLRIQADYMEWIEANPGFLQQVSKSASRRGSSTSDDISSVLFKFGGKSGSRRGSSTSDIISSAAMNLHHQGPINEEAENGNSTLIIHPSNVLDVPSDSPAVLVTDTAKSNEHPPKNLRIEAMQLDLSSLNSVKNFADKFIKKGYPLHRLICNYSLAGAEQETTKDGYEIHFQSNYLGHLLLILQLLPIMRSSGDDIRIINVSSEDHYKGSFDLAKIKKQKPGAYSTSAVYANTKLFQIMMTYALERRLQSSPISCFSLSPGHIDTQTVQNMEHTTKSKFASALMRTLSSTESDTTKGAATSIYLAVSPNLHHLHGYYFNKGAPATTSAKARKEKDQEVLWNYSLECLKKYLNTEILDGLDTVTLEAQEEANETTSDLKL